MKKLLLLLPILLLFGATHATFENSNRRTSESEFGETILGRGLLDDAKLEEILIQTNAYRDSLGMPKLTRIMDMFINPYETNTIIAENPSIYKNNTDYMRDVGYCATENNGTACTIDPYTIALNRSKLLNQYFMSIGNPIAIIPQKQIDNFNKYVGADQHTQAIQSLWDSMTPNTAKPYPIRTGPNLDYQTIVTRLHDNGMTSYQTLSDFRPSKHITREEVSKFYASFAKNIMHKTEDESLPCDFLDIEDADPTLITSIISACRLGIVKGSNGYFNPKGELHTDESSTMLMRILTGMLPENGAKYYTNYWKAGQAMGLFGEFKRMPERRLNVAVYMYEYVFPEYRNNQFSTSGI